MPGGGAVWFCVKSGWPRLVLVANAVMRMPSASVKWTCTAGCGGVTSCSAGVGVVGESEP